MSVKNYHAWIRAARKASAKTGGLSLPAARKAYKKMAAKLDRPLKGTDVKKHPIIFKRSIPKSSGGIAPKRTSKEIRKPVSAKPVRAPRERVVRSIDEYLEMLQDDLALQEDLEYVSTAEYKKAKGRG